MRRPSRPAPATTPLPAPQRPALHLSGLRIPRACSLAQPGLKPTPGAPEGRTPAAPRPRAAALREPRRRPARPSHQIRPIRDVRLRLEPNPIRSGPPDRDPTAWIQTYRFGLALFLKRPSAFPYSTRSPPLFKRNCCLVQNLAPSPLSFLNIEPAILAW